MLHQIGVGALGPVFRAFDPARDRLVAVKRFQLDVPPERMQELVRIFERLIAAELTHPALASPVATGIDGTAAYLAMDYVMGDSLDTLVRDYGAAPPAEALRVATQLAGALDFAAVVNAEHGALHPRDVLLSSEETRLTGIGVARALETIGVTVPARRPYSAPERHAGHVWDRRSDIFSLAALIHELLWARRIGGAGSRAADGLTEIPGGNLPALRDVFARALAAAPADRFGTALEFAEALKAALPNISLVASQPAAKRPRGQALPLLDDAELPLAPLDEPRAEATTRFDAEPAPPAMPTPILIDDAREERELDLRQAEAERYQDVESAPAIVEPLPPPRRDPSPDFVDTRPEFMASAIEQSRSAVWPLVLALIVGVAIGFAGGYGIGSRDRTAPAAAAATGTPASTHPIEPASPGEHDSTEVAVADPQKGPPVGSTGSSDAPAAPPATPVPPAKPPVAPDAAATANGRLLVRSSPAGARVFVDGHEYGKTPLAVRDLGRGAHRVRVVREGYGTEERRIVLTATRPAQSMTVPLERDRAQIAQSRKATSDSRTETPGTAGRFAGPLTIDSRPTGANVFLDGKLVGTTPLQLPEVSAGEHAVRLEHDGFRLWSSSVRVIATERNRVTASLER